MTLIAIMKYKIVSSLALAVLGITAIAPFASAVPRFVKSGVNNDVTGAGFTSGQKVELTYAGVVSTKDVAANSCGRLTFSGLSSSSTVAVNGQTVAVSSAQVLPSVPGGSPTSSAGCDNWTGKIAQPDGTFKLYIGSNTAGVRYTASISGPAIRKATANSCGFIKLTNSGNWKDKSFTYSGTAVTPTSISVAPQCKDGVALYPTNFPGVSFTP